MLASSTCGVPYTTSEGSCCVFPAHGSAFIFAAKHSALCVLSGQGATPCPAGAQHSTRVFIPQAEVMLLPQAAQVQWLECHLSGGSLTLHLCLSGPVSSQSSQVLPVSVVPLCDGMLAGWVSQAPAICTSFCMLVQDMLSGVLSLPIVSAPRAIPSLQLSSGSQKQAAPFLRALQPVACRTASWACWVSEGLCLCHEHRHMYVPVSCDPLARFAWVPMGFACCVHA